MRIIFGGNSDIGKAINGHHLLRDECDITKYNDVFKAVTKYNPTEIVNCAGFICPSSISDSQYWDWAKEIEVNLMGSYYVAHLGLMRCKKFVFIGSTSGLRGRANWSGYCASKAGLISLVQSLAEEGYDAYCVNPSRTDTKMRNELFPDEDKSTLIPPSRIANVVEDCFKGVFKSGSSITVRKDKIEVME